MVPPPQRARSRNAIPLLVGYIGDAMVGDHRRPRLRHAAENVEAGTEGTRELAHALHLIWHRRLAIDLSPPLDGDSVVSLATAEVLR